MADPEPRIKSEEVVVKPEEEIHIEELHFEDLDKSNSDGNDRNETVVLRNIELSEATEGGQQIEFLGKIISQANSDGNLEINTLEEDDVIHTYIISEDNYQGIDGETIIYETGEGENSIEYFIEDGSTEYTTVINEDSNLIEYTSVEIIDESESLDDKPIAVEEIEDDDDEEDDESNEVESIEDDDTNSVYYEEREWNENEESSDAMVIDQEVDKTSVDAAALQEVKKEEYSSCGICDKSFRTLAGLKRHVTIYHEKKEDNDFDDPLSLELCPCCGEPWDSAHTIGDYKCEHCDKLFVQVNFLQRHKSIEHPTNEGRFVCVECKREFAAKSALVDHMKVHPVKNVKCLDCNKEFSRKYHLDRHIGQTGCMGQPRKMYDCRVCDKYFTRKDNLAEHLRNHAGQSKQKKKYTCQYCQKQCQGITLLNVHVRTHTGDRPYQCDLCPKRFPSTGAMKKHRRKHTGEKPYSCDQCHRKFSAKETLNRHYRIHTGEKPHRCQFCGKAFIQPSQLRAHIFHHTGENAYTCSYCGRAFNRKLRLTNHIKYMHEGADPLPCSVCSKTFFRKEDVARHMLSHTGERPFSCEVCNKSFAVRSSLKIHMNTHRKEQPCSCETCGRAFIRRDCLMRHIRSRHRDVLEDIVANAEKKRLQEQLLTAAAASDDADEAMTKNVVWTELTLTESIKELLTLLVDEECLLEFGYPEAPVDKVLDSVIAKCGHKPASEEDFDYIGRIRENAKLLFTVVIDDEAVKELLNNQTVDEVIVHVLKLAKKPTSGSSENSK
ncbi:unnamed protein product [Phyllotreta striolata]|uniref:C2H2-type domain-containing protein n=1 Tax=Phyllotreta striolata TaxID=444603 RepID=A0A9N9TK13_PHYSR|nr:unnamed protein product [Phyllotreta striolata]